MMMMTDGFILILNHKMKTYLGELGHQLFKLAERIDRARNDTELKSATKDLNEFYAKQKNE